MCTKNYPQLSLIKCKLELPTLCKILHDSFYFILYVRVYVDRPVLQTTRRVACRIHARKVSQHSQFVLGRFVVRLLYFYEQFKTFNIAIIVFFLIFLQLVKCAGRLGRHIGRIEPVGSQSQSFRKRILFGSRQTVAGKQRPVGVARDVERVSMI